MSAPVAGFTSTETFDSTLRFGVFLRRFVPMLVGLYLAIVLLVRLVLALLGVGNLGWLLALALGVPVAVALVLSKKRQFDETWGTTRLELSATGPTMVNRWVRVHLPWQHIRHLGTAHLIITRESTTSGGGRAGLIANLLSLALSRTARGVRLPALVGIGSSAVGGGTSAAVRAQLRQNDSCREVDPVTGRRMTAIVLTVYDRNWRDGRIGGWIRAYRPDLLASTPPAAAPSRPAPSRPLPTPPRPPTAPPRPATPGPDPGTGRGFTAGDRPPTGR